MKDFFDNELEIGDYVISHAEFKCIAKIIGFFGEDRIRVSYLPKSLETDTHYGPLLIADRMRKLSPEETVLKLLEWA